MTTKQDLKIDENAPNAASGPISVASDGTPPEMATLEPGDPTDQIDVSPEISFIEIDRIEPDLGQPRKFFDSDALSNLKDSIAANSVLNPILVRASERRTDSFVIIDGQRRWQACAELKLKTIQCRVVKSDERGYQILALTQNMQREDLLPIEKANALAALLAKMKGENNKFKQKALTKIVNLKETSISEFLKISSLDPVIKNEAEKSQEWSSKKLLRLAKIKNIKSRTEKFLELKAVVDKKMEKARANSPSPPTPNGGGGAGTIRKPAHGGVSLAQARQRVEAWKKYLAKVKKADWKAADIAVIKNDLETLLKILDEARPADTTA
ncbi:MAG: ParB/RepB/Spo0J family partition protein [Deltaproteobacteria bacterium]|jgi:ParB/RepB/Spo0J family partition protein|nr:ParB/RepB/Spo0J family partition protein [Deltaproteobacteria bacterium]